MSLDYTWFGSSLLAIWLRPTSSESRDSEWRWPWSSWERVCTLWRCARVRVRLKPGQVSDASCSNSASQGQGLGNRVMSWGDSDFSPSNPIRCLFYFCHAKLALLCGGNWWFIKCWRHDSASSALTQYAQRNWLSLIFVSLWWHYLAGEKFKMKGLCRGDRRLPDTLSSFNYYYFWSNTSLCMCERAYRKPFSDVLIN